MNLLIDVNGVLYVGKKPVPGAADAVDRLRDAGHRFRFVSNATQACKKTLQKKLSSLGFSIRKEELFTAPSAAVKYVLGSGRDRCFLLSTGDVHLDFVEAGIMIAEDQPDFVVVGDAAENFSFENMNLVFRMLMEGASFLALETDRYWNSGGVLSLCAGPYVKALEYASGRKAVLVGKPSPEFFLAALGDMGARPEETMMVGDDIFSDVSGAQRVGMRAYLVKTGKYRKEEVEASGIKPDQVLGSITDLFENI